MAFRLVLALGVLAACSPPVAVVQVTIPDLDGRIVPVPGLTVTFLPYDRDSIVAALERAGSPRPHVRALDSLFTAFREPYRAAARAAAALEYLTRVRDSLRSSGADVRAVDDSVRRLTVTVADARASLERARERLGPTIDSLRAEVVRWEDSTTGGYAGIVKSLGDRVFANPVADTTSSTGWAGAELTGGKWWVTAKTIDPTDPNREWYWNLQITTDTLYLNPQTGRNRPRY